MAKIMVNHPFSAHRRLVAARKDSRWIKAELEALPAALEEKREARRNALVHKLNKKLEKSAFDACDKEEYALAQKEELLRKFDVRHYMDQRAVNHGTAKRIFSDIHNGRDWKGILVAHEENVERLRGKRSGYQAELEKKKKDFLAKHGGVNDGEYLRLRARAEVELAEKERQLAVQYDRKLAQRREKLEAKLKRAQHRIDTAKASMAHDRALPEDVLLRVKGLKMYFSGLKAVDDLTFDVKKGQIFGLIGPNGAGKTTVFNCITRFYDATDGEMYFENKHGEVIDLRNFRVHQVIMEGITRTFQNVELVREISVLDNLLVACTQDYRSGLVVQALGLPSLRKEEKVLKEKAMEILKFMGLEHYAAWLAMGLPYGVLKKVEIARALMSDAKLIIMDEPAAGLNDTETAELTRIIRRIRDEFGVTILLVEHDMSLVMNVCDTICAISFGKMLAIGTCDEIKRNKAVQEAYLGVEGDL